MRGALPRRIRVGDAWYPARHGVRSTRGATSRSPPAPGCVLEHASVWLYSQPYWPRDGSCLLLKHGQKIQRFSEQTSCCRLPPQASEEADERNACNGSCEQPRICHSATQLSSAIAPNTAHQSLPHLSTALDISQVVKYAQHGRQDPSIQQPHQHLALACVAGHAQGNRKDTARH